ncbi:MAG: AAA family ATPase [Cocleimonas sp.]|nr:AAA family ATPase [Cocleimonas sp.]
MSNSQIPHFPFSAVIGQDKLKTALLLAACDPSLGGVLISGNRGIAKSTLARSLADLLLHHRAFVNCPLGVSEDRLLGSLDVEYALAKGGLKFSPGLFAQAHGGVLYVDEINLLPDHLVDLLLDVSASGVNYVERDGISHQHKAQFVLIGSMNPEEGALRPQLLDRFGLSVEIHDNPDLQQRMAIVESRLAFDHDPLDFCEQYAERQSIIRQLLHDASQRLKQVNASAESKLEIAQRCLQAGVEGVRADLALFRAARAHAAIRGGNNILDEDINAVTDLVLAHRQQEEPQQKLAQNSSEKKPQENNYSTPQQSAQSSGSEEQSPQGDWGEMPVEDVAIGLSRQLDPAKFSHQLSLAQKKKQ